MTKASANPTPANWFRQGSAIMRLSVIQKAPDVENCRLFPNSLRSSWFWGVGKVLKMLLLFPTVHREERREKARSKLLTTLLPVYSMSNWKPKSCSEKMRRGRQQSPFKSSSWEPRHLSPPYLRATGAGSHPPSRVISYSQESQHGALSLRDCLILKQQKKRNKKDWCFDSGFWVFLGGEGGGGVMWIKALSLVCCDFCLHTIPYFQILGQLLSIQKSNWNIRKCFMKFSMIEYMFKSQIKLHYTIRKSKKAFQTSSFTMQMCLNYWANNKDIFNLHYLNDSLNNWMIHKLKILDDSLS